jgi:hypothetical protein
MQEAAAVMVDDALKFAMESGEQKARVASLVQFAPDGTDGE